MNISKKALSLLSAAALLIVLIAAVIPMAVGASSDPYDGAEVKWNGTLTVDTAGIGGNFGSSNQQAVGTVNFSGKDYLLFTVKNNTGVAANLFFLTLKSNQAAGYEMKLLEGGKYAVMASGEAAFTEKTITKVNVAGAGDMLAMTVPAGESVVRLPLNSTAISGLATDRQDASVENDKYVLSIIDTMEVYANAPGAGSDKTVALTKFAVADKAAPAENPAYDGAEVKWNGTLTVDTTGIGGHFGSSNQQAVGTVNFSGKDYLLFTVKNNTGVAANLFFLTLKSNQAAGYEMKLLEGGKYAVMASGEAAFTEKTITKVNVAGAGDMLAMTVPAGESVVRLPLNSTAISGLATDRQDASVENDKYVLSIIDTMEVYANAPGAGSDKTVVLTKFAVADKADAPESSAPESSAPESSDPEPSAPSAPVYEATDKIQLNPGEKAYFITGFEDSDNVGFLTQASRIRAEIVAEGANNGEKAMKFTFTDGSPSGFDTYTLDTSAKSNWTGAKYIQFYIKNNSRCDNPLQLFYVKFAGRLLTYSARGVMLYNMNTGKWTETTIVGNFAHVMGSTPVPSVNITAGFEGYVRIPLTDGNFDKPLDLSDVSNIELYTIIEGTPGNETVYIDDYALVTYDGDKAPDYVDGEPKDEPESKPEEELDTTFILSGKLNDENGKPLAGARITMANNSTSGNRTAVTDKNGQFRFDNVKSGWAELTVIGADGTDYGYITYNFTAVRGETSAVGTNVNVSVDAKGLIVTIGMDTLGLDPVSVAEGVLDVTPGTDSSDTAGSDAESSVPDAVDTGVTSFALLAFAAGGLALGVIAVSKRRKA